MKRYKKYMDSVEVSPELHQKLTELTGPKRAVGWKKYGAMAAALALVVGAGAFGLSRMDRDDILYETAERGDPEPVQCAAPAESEIAIGLAPAGDWGNQTDGGYEIVSGEIAAYYLLPAIVYNEPDSSSSADYSLAPPGSLSRAAGLDDVKALLGGADMAGHLLWTEDLDWSGTAWFLDDGTPCAATLWAEGNGVSLVIEMMAGSEVPSCVVYSDNCYETTEFCGVEITALKNPGWAVVDGVELRESRQLSCFAGGIGCKLTIYGVDGERVENMCARFVRWAIVEGFDLSALTVDGSAPVYADPGCSVGEPNWEEGASSPSQGPQEEVSTPAYDPNA